MPDMTTNSGCVKSQVREVGDAMACNVDDLEKMSEELDSVKESTHRLERLLSKRVKKPGIILDRPR